MIRLRPASKKRAAKAVSNFADPPLNVKATISVLRGVRAGKLPGPLGFAMFLRIVSRRNLTPPHPVPAPDRHGTRRQTGGARHEASERVRLFARDSTIEGWTLNVSRGGVRIIVEDPVELGRDYEITIGDDEHVRRPCRIVWVQEEADGQIAGVQYLDTSTGPPPPPPPAPPTSSAPPGV